MRLIIGLGFYDEPDDKACRVIAILIGFMAQMVGSEVLGLIIVLRVKKENACCFTSMRFFLLKITGCNFYLRR